MSKVRCLSSNELVETKDIGKEEENPTRKFKLCSCKRFGSAVCDYAVVVIILLLSSFTSLGTGRRTQDAKKIALPTSDSEEYATKFFHQCLDCVIPCFWSRSQSKHYFRSSVHPKKYCLLHLAVEQNSLIACKAIMRCSDRWLNVDPGLYAEDTDGNTPIDKAVLSQLWVCLEYLQQSQLYVQDAETTVKKAKMATLQSKISLELT